MRKHKQYILIALALFGLCCVARCATGLPTTSVTVRVLDDDGLPVENASAYVAFEVTPNPDDRDFLREKKGATNKDGFFYASNECIGRLYFGVRKTGFYESLGNRFDLKLNKSKTGWLPKNPELIVILKKIINPVPMYVRKINMQVPELNKPIGLDLEMGDWVEPYGKGIISDFIFTARRRFASDKDFDASISLAFQNENDGIQYFEAKDTGDSRLKSSQTAPETGYRNEWRHEVSESSGKRIGWGPFEKDNYIFRTRTILNKDGTIAKANYGKIYGALGFASLGQPNPVVYFTCYYNPDPQSRSLEFDLTRNLISRPNEPRHRSSYWEPTVP